MGLQSPWLYNADSVCEFQYFPIPHMILITIMKTLRLLHCWYYLSMALNSFCEGHLLFSLRIFHQI